MPATYNLQIVTPEREVYNAEVESLRLPGVEGSFGVLRNHAPIVAGLDAGIVHMVDAEIRKHAIAIAGGFFQMAQNKAILLADSAEFAREINVQAAQEDEKNARSQLDSKLDPEFKTEREQAAKALKMAQIRQRASSIISK